MKFPSIYTQQFLTAVLLTVFVFGLQFAVPEAQMRAAADARKMEEFGLKLRTLAHESAMIEACIDEGLILLPTEEDTEPVEPPSVETPFAAVCMMATVSMGAAVPVNEYIENNIERVCVEDEWEKNPGQRKACAATLLVYGATGKSQEILQSMEEKDEAAQWLLSLTISEEERLQQESILTTEIDGQRLPEIWIAIFHLPEPLAQPADYSQETIEEIEYLPTVVVERLKILHAQALGNPEESAALQDRLRAAEQEAFEGQISLVIFEGFSVLLGLLLLLLVMIRPLRERFFAPYEKLAVPTVTIHLRQPPASQDQVGPTPESPPVKPVIQLGPFPITPLALYTIFIGWLAFQIMLGFAMNLPSVDTLLGGSEPIKTFVMMFAMGAFPLYLIKKLTPPVGETLSSALGFSLAPLRRAWGRSLALPYLSFAFWLPVSFVLTILTLILVGQPPIDTNPIISLIIDSSSALEMFVIALSATVLAPVFEEALFRGFLYRVLRARSGPIAGAVITSIIFAAIHPSIITFLPLFGLSFLLCLLYEKTGSIWPSVVLHGLNNLVALMAVATALRDITP